MANLYKLHKKDCIEVMRSMSDKSVDCIVTDPPYGINADIGVGGFGVSKTDKHYQAGWDNETPTAEYFSEMLRIAKRVLIFGGNFFTDKLPVGRHWVVWDKTGEIKFQNPFGDAELMWTNIDKNSIKKYVVIQQGFVSKEKERFHPTQKPVQLLRSIIYDYTLEGETIFDPYMGSGTTGIACLQAGRNFIGCEISQKYFSVAKSRIQSAALQPALFPRSPTKRAPDVGDSPRQQTFSTPEANPLAKGKASPAPRR